MKHFLIEAIIAGAMVLAICSLGAVIGFILYKVGLFPDLRREKSTRKRYGRALAIMVGFAYVVQSCAKMSHFGPMVQKWDQFNLTYLLTYVGMAEFSLGVILLFPKTYKGSVLLLTAVAGGAIATHLPLHADGFGGSIPSAMFLAIVWFSAVLYSPEMFPDFISNLFHKNTNRTSRATT